MASAVHQHESAMGTHVTPPSCTLLPLPPHPVPPDCLRAPALGPLYHTSNSHWLSVLHMLMYVFQCYSLKSSHPLLLLCP